MPDIEVLLAVGHPVFRDPLAVRLAREEGLRVKQCGPGAGLFAAGPAGVDVVITDEDAGEIPGPCTHLLDQYPSLTVFVISRTSDRVFLYQQMTSVQELQSTPDEIIGAIRAIRRRRS
jgi:hypothetical protein